MIRIKILVLCIFAILVIAKAEKLICRNIKNNFNEPVISELTQIDLQTCILEELTVLSRSQDVIMESNLDDIQAIKVEGCTWKYNPDITFQKMSNVFYLKIGKNQGFEGFEMEDFKGASKLTHLYVHGNEDFKELGPRVFSLTKLLYISLENNGITRIHKLAFEGISSIRKINLQANKIQMIHVTTFNNVKSLGYVDLRYNLCIAKFLKELSYIAQSLLISSCHSYYIQNELQEIQHSKDTSMNIGVILEIISIMLTIAGIGLFMKVKSSF